MHVPNFHNSLAVENKINWINWKKFHCCVHGFVQFFYVADGMLIINFK
uniref:Uncharacterized protein n=1 Tax=Anguilla anguilla TaxID=7936 RepID=A0A0E9S2C6_ANGAN